MVVRRGLAESVDSWQKKQELIRLAVDTRRLEIELFWRRSLFFWGFITTAFVAYGNFSGEREVLALASASFGLVCSQCWTLVNRGSKYWQENWEAKVERIEEEAFERKVFGSQEEVQDKGVWLSARRYSVSKLTIALSDFVLLLWLGLWIYQFSVVFGYDFLKSRLEIKGSEVLFFLTVGYVYAILALTVSSPAKNSRG